jgi:hypothetical protein
MKLRVFNKSESTVHLDSKGNNSPEDLIQLGPKGTAIIQVNSESDFVEFSKNNLKKLVVRKL